MGIKTCVSVGVLVAFTVGTVPCWADQPAVVSPVKRGQVAPYSGVLLSPPAVAQIVAQQGTVDAALQLAVQHQQELDAVNSAYDLHSTQTTCTADKAVLQAQLNDKNKQIVAITAQLKKQSSAISPGVWVGIGVVSGVIVTVATVLIATKL
jgi:hypothetical protein